MTLMMMISHLHQFYDNLKYSKPNQESKQFSFGNHEVKGEEPRVNKKHLQIYFLLNLRK
jgi:hypothetical protein